MSKLLITRFIQSMKFRNIVLISMAIAFSGTTSIALAKQASKSGTTTYYSHGKPVGKSIVHGNTTTYYSKGKPVGKSVRH